MVTLIKKIILITLLFLSPSLFANVAKVVALKGNATIVREGTSIKLTRTAIIKKHDEIITKDNTKVQLLFKDETIISIGKNSSFQVENYLFDEKNKKFEAKFDMFKGTFKTITGKIGKKAPKNFILKTKTASIGIRGTQIVMNLLKDNEQIFCTEGKILVTTLDSKISSFVNAGEFVSLDNSKSIKIDVKKIKPNELKKINKNITIQNNLATDKISIQKESETTVEKDNDINIQPSPTEQTVDNNVATNEETLTESVPKVEEEESSKKTPEELAETKAEEAALAQ